MDTGAAGNVSAGLPAAGRNSAGAEKFATPAYSVRTAAAEYRAGVPQPAIMNTDRTPARKMRQQRFMVVNTFGFFKFRESFFTQYNPIF
jgi:hypothetical protein